MDKNNLNSFKILNSSCLDVNVDVVVNAANIWLSSGGGICGVIFEKAGYKELSKVCDSFDLPLNDGDAVFTPAFNLDKKGIIHSVGPNFSYTPDAFDKLFDAYYNSLVVLKDNGFHSISFPLISAGIFGGSLSNPVGVSTNNCYKAFIKFINDFPTYIINVSLCAFTSDEYILAMEEYNKIN